MFDNVYIAKIKNAASIYNNNADTFFTAIVYKKGEKYIDLFNRNISFIDNSININNMCQLVEIKPLFINSKKLVKNNKSA